MPHGSEVLQGPRLVVGLGNPGPEYEWTRHNVGVHVVREFADRHRMVFRSERSCEAYIAKGLIAERSVIVAVPKTYMNESGRSVGRLSRMFQVDVSDLLVAVDDIETRWGGVQLAFGGGTRGHNGMKSVHALLGTKEFTQLRCGVGRPGSGAVSDYVLRRFSAEEMAELPAIIERAVTNIETWLGGCHTVTF